MWKNITYLMAVVCRGKGGKTEVGSRRTDDGQQTTAKDRGQRGEVQGARGKVVFTQEGLNKRTSNIER